MRTSDEPAAKPTFAPGIAANSRASRPIDRGQGALRCGFVQSLCGRSCQTRRPRRSPLALQTLRGLSFWSTPREGLLPSRRRAFLCDPATSPRHGLKRGLLEMVLPAGGGFRTRPIGHDLALPCSSLALVVPHERGDKQGHERETQQSNQGLSPHRASPKTLLMRTRLNVP